MLTQNIKFKKGLIPLLIPRCFRDLLLLMVLFCTTFLFYSNYYPNFFLLRKQKNIRPPYSNDEQHTIKTQECLIPFMSPFNKLIEKYVGYNSIKPCPDSNYSLLVQNGTHIWLNTEIQILRHYKIPIVKYQEIRCCYSSFYRQNTISNIYSHVVDNRIYYNKCIYFSDVKTVEDEFVAVTCVYHGRVIYRQFYNFVFFKNLTQNSYEEITNDEKTAFNVLIIGIDNMSRLNFHRTMPKTAKFLKRRNAVELMGYNKVGDNSYANVVPLLIGYSVNEIKHICHPIKWTTYDDCPFLWHWYKDAGYYTAFGEDSGLVGTFNYEMKGFRKSPTDYYFHPFITEAERIGKRNRATNIYLCIHEHYSYEILLNYTKAITDILFNYKLFGFFWETTTTHDYLNDAMVIDDGYLRFFRHMENSGYLDKTFIFLLSDHGIRWGEFRSTKQGYLEERLPLAFVLTPQSFRENYTEAFENLRYNSRQLTTPFDLHETLFDLIDLENIRNETIIERTKNRDSNKRGISLFLKVPQNRTCESAGIADHWCSCNRRVPVSNASMEIKNASKYLIEYLNLFLSGYPQCEDLSLDAIQESNRFDTKFEHYSEANWTEYSVVVRVKPSDGVFEATLRNDGESWSVIGTVSRLNLYEKQSDCVHDPRVKLYCHCQANYYR